MFEGIPVGVLTPSALLGACILMILTGRLVPRRTYDDAIHDRDEWRAECRIKEQHLGEALEQNDVLLREYGPAVSAFMASLRDAADKGKEAS